ncbi:potassium-transporting ATPase subunit KdpC [Jannaschia sp. R86511]|uniref:potassium-transporting ATPase subunit KdpC n=1 Tax=Jannaschia sp. R86511 TaxID=3093853 RepID=UPI0036D3398A
MRASLTLLARQSVAGLRLLLIATLVLGLAYPLAVHGVGRLVPDRADGSFVELDGRVVGSALIGQSFDDDGWFASRPSAAGDGYDPLASGASNLGPENTELLAAVQQRRADVAQREGVAPADVPADAVTASGSGLDPHISPAYADLQVPRVASRRGLDEVVVRGLVAQSTAGRDLGFLGEERVNVLRLNVSLDELSP